MTTHAIASPSPSTKLSLSTNTGQVGSPITVNGSGFPANTVVAVYVDDLASSAASPARLMPNGPVSDGQGNFQVVVPMTETTYGAHQICAAGGALKACAQFTVEPSLVLSIGSGPPGALITAYGAGFPAHEFVDFYIDASPSGLYSSYADIDAVGGFSLDLPWPGPDSVTAGMHILCADTAAAGTIGSSQPVRAKACSQFDGQPLGTAPAVFFTPGAAKSGDHVKLTVDHLAGDTHVYLSIDGAGSCDIGITNLSGNFQTSLLIVLQGPSPECPLTMPLGPHKICADAMVSACTSFTVLPGGVLPTPSPVTESPTPPLQSPTSTVAPTKRAAATNPSSSPVSARLLVISLGLALLIAAAVGASIWALRSRAPRSLPPLE